MSSNMVDFNQLNQEKENGKEDDDDEGLDECKEEQMDHDFYDWTLVPKTYPIEKKSGVTFKGDTEEYLGAHKKVTEMLNKKGMKYLINGVELRILDNAKNKPIKIDVKFQKGASGKVNVKIYNVNKLGFATMMISKTSDSEMHHVKTLAFKVCKYLFDGTIDGVIDEKDIENMRKEANISNRTKNNLTCETCEKKCMTENGLNIHKEKCHADVIVSANITPGKTVTETPELDFKARESKWTNECEVCDYKTKKEYDFKRHKRDKHGYWTQTISPQKKRRKQMTDNIENMETMDSEELIEVQHDLTDKDKVYWNDARKDVRKKEESEVLKERSQMQDNKVKQRQKRIEEEEEKNKREKELKIKKSKEEQDLAKKQKSLEKSKAKNKGRSLRKKELKGSGLKPWLRELPKSCKQILGADFVIFPVKGDGACGPNCAAAWIHQDPSLGPYLARNINNYIVKNWEYYKNAITFPFQREVGNGKFVECQNEQELFSFLLNDSDSAYMWRDHEDFSAVSSTYQMKIRIITITSLDDPYPRVSIIEPNPALAAKSVHKQGLIPEMLLLHEENTHYSLIIPRDSSLAIDGGLDNQREEASNHKIVEKNVAMNIECETCESHSKKVSYLESKCEQLMSENAKLAEKLRKHEERYHEEIITVPQNSDVKEIVEHTKLTKNLRTHEENDHKEINSNSSELDDKLKNPQAQPDGNGEDENHHCNLCAKAFDSEDLLNAHKRTHSPINFPCNKCGKEFVKDVQLDMHIKTNHMENKKQTKQFNCEDCSFQGTTSLELKKHTKITYHNPSPYTEQCHTCSKEFKSYKEMMDHRKIEHPSKRLCRYFKEGTCIFENEKCWWRHSSKLEEPLENLFPHNCQGCEMIFKTQNEMMKHKKREHRHLVSKCQKFMQGICDLNENSCWFLHTEQKMEVDGENEQVFHEVKEKIPPDQMMMDKIDKMMQRIQTLELKMLA